MALISTMFDSLATVKRSVTGKDASQGQTQTFTKIMVSGIPCSCQQAGVRVQELYAQRGTEVTTTIYFAQDPLLEANDLVVITNGRTGTVNNYIPEGKAQPNARGQFYEAHARLERKPT